MIGERIKINLSIILITVLVFLGTILSVMRFYQVISTNEYELQKESLFDMAKLEASLIEVKLEDYINTLYYIAEFMGHEELYTEEHMKLLNHLLDGNRFQQLGIITLDGILHDTMGDVNVSDRDYYKGISNGESFVTGIITSRFTGEEIIAMAVPVYDESGEILGAVHGTVLLEEFEPYSGTSLAEGNVDTYIFDRNGKYIIKNNKQGASRNYDNIFDHLRQAENGISIEELKNAVFEGRSVTTEVISGDVSYLCCFVPIRNGEWYALVDTRTEEINEKVAGILNRDFYKMLISLLLMMVFLCAAVLIWNHRRNVWERKHEVELRERLMAKVVGLMVVDLDEGRILSRSGSGLLREDMSRISYQDYITDVVETGAEQEHKKSILKFFSPEDIRADAEAGFRERTMEFKLQYMPDAESVWLECESRLDWNERKGHLIVSHILRDIDRRKQEELALRSEAERDMLTGLYNRNTCTKMIEQYLSLSDDTVMHAFVLLDLDNFKLLNDTFGHQYGDKALKDVADIIAAHFHSDDIVCRLGGDEFVIFIKDISENIVRKILAPLLKRLHLSYEKDGRIVEICASAGIAFTASDDSFEKLYHDADHALYEAKRSGKATFREYQ